MAPTDHHLTTPAVFFYHIISLTLSHPLYLSYAIFFSPYIFRFISFISPLLLLLSVLASTLPLSNLGFVQTTPSKMDDDDEFRQFEDLEIYKIVFHGPPPVLTDGEGEDGHVAVTVGVTESDEEKGGLESLFEELDRFEASTNEVEALTSSVSGEDQETDEDSWRLDSSSSFGSCGSTTASSPIGEVAGELPKLELLTSSVSGEHKETVKLNSPAAIETKGYKTTSHVREVLKKFEPVTSAFPDENKKSVKSYSTVTSSISGKDQKSMTDNKTTSHFRGVIQKLQPVTSSVSGEDLKTGKSSSMAAIEMKSNKTTSHQKSSPVTSSISGEGIKTVKSNSTVTSSVSGIKSHSTVREVFRNSSPAVTSSFSGEDKSSVQNSPALQLNSWRLDSSTSFGSYGSMRKEKEWKRTLACKLFEERNNSEGGEEGMDSLWEAYEDDNSRKSKNWKEAAANNNNSNNKKHKKKREFKYFDDGEDDEDEDDEDEFMSNGQLCCLKALKLSTGKMNLGMGKPNLVKITKAIKGFGWLHHVGSKHGKRH